jgi:hypothetical protein
MIREADETAFSVSKNATTQHVTAKVNVAGATTKTL